MNHEGSRELSYNKPIKYYFRIMKCAMQESNVIEWTENIRLSTDSIYTECELAINPLASSPCLPVSIIWLENLLIWK